MKRSVPIGARHGQSAVETMLCVPFVMTLFMAMYYFWSIAFGSQNNHIRSREYVLHEMTYQGDRPGGATGSTVWDGDHYQLAEPGQSFTKRGSSTDTSIPGFGQVELSANSSIVVVRGSD